MHASCCSSRLPRTRRPLALCAFTVLFLVVAAAARPGLAADDLKAAEGRVRKAKDAADRAHAQVAAAEKERDRALAELDKAQNTCVERAKLVEDLRARVAEARRPLDLIRTDQAGIKKRVTALGKRADAKSPAVQAEIRRLEKRHKGLNRVAEEYLSAVAYYAGRLRDVEEGLETHRGRAVAARQALEAKQKVVEATEGVLWLAEDELEKAVEARDEARNAVPPPYLSEVKVEQDGKVVYQARWEPGVSVMDEVERQLAEMQAELEELGTRRKRVRGDRKRHLEEVVKRQAEGRSGSPYTATLVAEMASAARQVLASGYPGSHGPKQTWSGIRTSAKRRAISIITTAFKNSRIWYWDPERPNTTLGYKKSPADIARDLYTHVDRRVYAWKSWPQGDRYIVKPSRRLSGGYYSSPGNIRLVDPVLYSSGLTIEGFSRELDVLHVYGVSREALESQFLAELAKAKFGGATDSRRTFEIGVYIAMHQLTAGELTMIDKLIEARQRMIGLLRAQIPNAATRAFGRAVDKKLTVAPGQDAAISLTFSAPLSAPPAVTFGKESLDAGAAPAAKVKLTGAGANWSGVFPTIGLAPFAKDKRGVRLRVSGTDTNGRILDADPTTTAALAPDGKWANWEELRHGVAGKGQGGTDVWHVLNRDHRAGISYCFALDASRSMKDNNRMATAKASIEAAIAKMADQDEVALWVFYTCGRVQLAVGFTQDKRQVLNALKPVQPSGSTPLAAAIYEGGKYLVGRGMFENKVLVILTDGEETCEGNPQAAAAFFRQMVRVEGFGAGGRMSRPIGDKSPRSPLDVHPRPKPKPTPDKPKPKPKPEQPKEPEIVKVIPADRSAYEVREAGRSVLVIQTRFHEWGRDDNCLVAVVRREIYVHDWRYRGKSGWRLNSQPSRVTRLDYALSSQGQAAMDRVRSKWKKLPGGSWEEAEPKIQRLVKIRHGINPDEKEGR